MPLFVDALERLHVGGVGSEGLPSSFSRLIRLVQPPRPQEVSAGSSISTWADRVSIQTYDWRQKLQLTRVRVCEVALLVRVSPYHTHRSVGC